MKMALSFLPRKPMGRPGRPPLVYLLTSLCLLWACEDDLLGPERFAYANPSERAAGDRDGGDTDGGGQDGTSADSGAGNDGDAGPEVKTTDAGTADAGGKVCATDLDCLALDDGNLCNGIWTCQSAGATEACAPKAASAVTCSKESDTTCAISTCDPGTGACNLQSLPDGSQCDDGEPCTDGDACKDGACASGVTLACACTQDMDCAALEDGDACNGTLKCGSEGGQAACVIDPATVIQCDAGKDSTCLKNSCQKASGACAIAATNEGGNCTADGNKCTAALVCTNGQCMASEGSDCDDGNPCTANGCDPAKGCVFKSQAADGKGCDVDGKLCASADTCKGGNCLAGPPKDCDDGDPCTDDLCDTDTGACSHKKSC